MATRAIEVELGRPSANNQLNTDNITRVQTFAQGKQWAYAFVEEGVRNYRWQVLNVADKVVTKDNNLGGGITKAYLVRFKVAKTDTAYIPIYLAVDDSGLIKSPFVQTTLNNEQQVEIEFPWGEPTFQTVSTIDLKQIIAAVARASNYTYVRVANEVENKFWNVVPQFVVPKAEDERKHLRFDCQRLKTDQVSISHYLFLDPQTTTYPSKVEWFSRSGLPNQGNTPNPGFKYESWYAEYRPRFESEYVIYAISKDLVLPHVTVYPGPLTGQYFNSVTPEGQFASRIAANGTGRYQVAPANPPPVRKEASDRYFLVTFTSADGAFTRSARLWVDRNNYLAYDKVAWIQPEFQPRMVDGPELEGGLWPTPDAINAVRAVARSRGMVVFRIRSVVHDWSFIRSNQWSDPDARERVQDGNHITVDFQRDSDLIYETHVYVNDGVNLVVQEVWWYDAKTPKQENQMIFGPH